MKPYQIIILLFAINTCFSQVKTSYIIDATIGDEIEKLTTSGDISMGAMKIKFFENDILSIDSGNKTIQTLQQSTIENDTVKIVGFVGMFGGFGYHIEMVKAEYQAHLFLKSDALSYKLKQEDSLDYGIFVPSKFAKLTISNNPKFTKNEVISGIIEINSEPFIEITNGEEKVCRVELIAYFKTEPLLNFEDIQKKIEESINGK